MDHTAVLDGALGDRYVSEFFGLRPEVLLALYVERGLWDRFLAGAADRPATTRSTRTASAPTVAPMLARGRGALRPSRLAVRTVANDERRVTPPELALVVPCHNEAARLDPEAFLQFLATHPACSSCWWTMGATTGRARSSSGCARRRRRR